MMDQEKIGKFIKERRQELGLTQKQIADALGITAKAVSKWECGQNAPDISLLVDLSKILNVTTDEILIGSKESEKKPTMDKVTTRKLRVKTITEIVLLILVLAITTATVFFGTYYVENKNKCSIYRIYTQSTELEAEGYIFKVGGKVSIVLGKFLSKGLNDETVLDYKITLEIDGKVIMSKEVGDGKTYNLQEIISKQNIYYEDKVNIISSDKLESEKTILIFNVNYTNKDHQKKNKRYIFKLKECYSN